MDVRKLKDKATEAFSKGKFARAGEAYAEYCAADPKDLQARLRMGDAWAKCGQPQKAIAAYSWAAEGFAKEGFLPRAIAASKLILELDPSHKGVQKMLADLYARKTAPGATKRPTLAMPLKRHEAIDLPPEEFSPSVAAEPVSSGPSPTNNANAIEIEVEPEVAARKPPEAVELDVGLTGVSSGASSSAEIEIPIAQGFELEVELPEPRSSPQQRPVVTGEPLDDPFDLELDPEALTVKKPAPTPKTYSLDDDIPSSVPSIIVAPELFEPEPPPSQPPNAPPVFNLDEGVPPSAPRPIDDDVTVPSARALAALDEAVEVMPSMPTIRPHEPKAFALDDGIVPSIPPVTARPIPPPPAAVPKVFDLDAPVPSTPAIVLPSQPGNAPPVFNLDEVNGTENTIPPRVRSVEADELGSEATIPPRSGEIDEDSPGEATIPPKSRPVSHAPSVHAVDTSKLFSREDDAPGEATIPPRSKTYSLDEEDDGVEPEPLTRLSATAALERELEEPEPLTHLAVKSKSLELDLDPDALAAELGFGDDASIPAPLTSPPGLRQKKGELTTEPALPNQAVDAELTPKAPGRIWLPPSFAGGGLPPTQAASNDVAAAQPTGFVARAPMTELEKSLDIFSQFDVDLTPVMPPPSAPRSFTELELDGDSLLHAVEAAAGQEQNVPSVEERMEAPDDSKLEPGALPKIPLFSDLPEDAFIALFERCPLRRREPGDVLIQQGSQGDSFFVICAGSVKVYRMDGDVRRDIATLQEGAFFGEMALLSGAPRTASVEAASEDTQLLEISASVLAELSQQHPTVAQALKKFCRQRLLTNLMGSSALFAPFTRTDRRKLVEKFRARDVPRGEVLIKEGQRSDGMYVILSGEVEVRVGVNAVASLHEGDIFGEMSLLTKASATATCAAARRTSLLRLPREDFDHLILSHPQILVLVSELTDERKKQNATLASRATSTASDATPMV